MLYRQAYSAARLRVGNYADPTADRKVGWQRVWRAGYGDMNAIDHWLADGAKLDDRAGRTGSHQVTVRFVRTG